jgi:hypothetical protein
MSPTNAERADRARATLRYYGTCFEDADTARNHPATCATDLLADLMHLFDGGLTFLTMAEIHHAAEVSKEEEE